MLEVLPLRLQRSFGQLNTALSSLPVSLAAQTAIALTQNGFTDTTMAQPCPILGITFGKQR